MRCEVLECSKKIKLTDQIIGLCKCGKTFCVLHRLGETHDCEYKHKTEINVEEFINKNKCIGNKTIKI